MTEYHILPNYSVSQHICSETCQCKPTLRPDEDTNGQRVWQHNDPNLRPPFMASGLMGNGRSWTLFKVSNAESPA